MNPILVASADDIIEQILIQCWLFEARGGDYAGARLRAERTLERLLAAGLPHAHGASGPLLDPYAANNRIKARVGDPVDEAWVDWQRTTRRNAVSLPNEAQLYQLTLRREWHKYAVTPGRPVVLRAPLPLRGSQQGAATITLVEPAGKLISARESPGRIELRVEPPEDGAPIIAEVTVKFIGGEQRDTLAPAASLGAVVDAADEVWLRDREGLVIQTPAVTALAKQLAEQSRTTREFVYAAWRWLITQLRFGDVHRSALDMNDPLGGLLNSRVSDCIIGSSLLVALCRAIGIPARILSGYLLHPANLGPHSWAEIRLAPDHWVPVDFGAWCYSAGNPDDPEWGNFFRGRVDARFIAEVAPRDFTGWGSAPPPERWYRLERLHGNDIEHTLHVLPDNALFRRDRLGLKILSAV